MLLHVGQSTGPPERLRGWGVWGGRGALLQYLGQFGVWSTIEGGNGIYTCLLPCQKTESASHAESHAPNLYHINGVLISSLEEIQMACTHVRIKSLLTA